MPSRPSSSTKTHTGQKVWEEESTLRHLPVPLCSSSNQQTKVQQENLTQLKISESDPPLRWAWLGPNRATGNQKESGGCPLRSRGSCLARSLLGRQKMGGKMHRGNY